MRFTVTVLDEHVPAGLDPLVKRRGIGGQCLPAARTHDEHLIGRELASLIRADGHAGLFEVILPGRVADVQ
ncbi:MAG: hypothetical protein ACLQCB_19330, partial [Spirochaetia bacterium]